MSTQEKERYITPPMRVWFPPHLLTRRVQKDPTKGEGKYGLTLVIAPAALDAQDKELWTKIVRATNAKAVEKFKKTLAEFPDSYKKPWHSGREKKEYDMTEAQIYMNCSSKFMPSIAGPDAKKIENPLPDYIYPGCWVRISTAPYAYDRDGGKGVALGVFNVMFVRDDQRLAFRTEPEEDFASYSTTTATGGAPLTDDDLGL